MRLDKRAYHIIYRIRRRPGSPEISTEKRTIYLPAGTDENDLRRPVLRLIYHFGFVAQYRIEL